jgi:hypothetical protein
LSACPPAVGHTELEEQAAVAQFRRLLQLGQALPIMSFLM